MNISTTSSLEELLNAYIADEYFANLQYKMAKVVAKGKALNHSNKVFDDNGDEEEDHFEELVEYAQSLNIKVQVNPSEMTKNCTTPFVNVFDGDTTAQLISILISAEKKAIEGYEIGLKNTSVIETHPELTHVFGELLTDERKHLKELEDVLSSIEASGCTVPQSVMTVCSELPDEEDVSSSEECCDKFLLDDETYDTDEEYDNTIDYIVNIDNCNTVDVPKKYAANIRQFVDKDESRLPFLLKELFSVIPEQNISCFANDCDYFSPELAREIHPNSERCCADKFIEMVEDGILEQRPLLEKLLEYLNDEDLKGISINLGYINNDIKDTPIKLNCGISFSDIFNKLKFGKIL